MLLPLNAMASAYTGSSVWCSKWNGRTVFEDKMTIQWNKRSTKCKNRIVALTMDNSSIIHVLTKYLIKKCVVDGWVSSPAEFFGNIVFTKFSKTKHLLECACLWSKQTSSTCRNSIISAVLVVTSIIILWHHPIATSAPQKIIHKGAVEMLI